MDLLEALDRTFQHTHDVIVAVPAAKLDAPTPCEEWRVRDLLEHMIGVVAGLGAAVSGASPSPFALGHDPASQFEGIAKTTLDAWRAPGALERSMEGPAGSLPGQVYAGINLLDTATTAGISPPRAECPRRWMRMSHGSRSRWRVRRSRRRFVRDASPTR